MSAQRPGFDELVERARRHLAAGRPAPAHEAAADAVRQAPGSAEGWTVLGRAVAGLGRRDEAAAILARAGELSASAGDLESARQRLEEAAALAPDRWEPRFGLGQVLLAAGRGAEARAAFEAAAAGDPAAVPPRLMLGRLLERGGSPAEASARYREVLAVQPRHPDALSELGFLEKLAGRYTESEALFRAALAARADHAGGAMGLAGLLELKGDYDAALEVLEPALSGTGGDPALELVAARVERRARGPAAARDRLLRLAAARLADTRLRGRVLFQLAQVDDELERYEEAFRCAREANALRRDGRWNAQAHSTRVDGIIARWPPGAGEPSGEESELPLFVIGMPRSGTTLVEHLLAAHPEVLPGGERNDIVALAAALSDRLPSRERLLTAAAGYLAASPGPARRVVDKMPVNFLHLGLVGRLFPRAHVVHCRRDPLDTGLSCFMQEFSGVEFGFSWDLADIGHYWRDYRRLMAHWREACELPVVEQDYEALVADAAGARARLLADAGLEVGREAGDDPSRVIATSSHAQVRRPVYSTSVGRARHYARWLDPLARALEG